MTTDNISQEQLFFKFSNLFKRDYYLLTIVLFVLPLSIYWQVYYFEFLWDDGSSAMGHLNNLYVQKPSFEHLIRLFTNSFFGMYVPINYLFWGSIKWLAGFFSLPASGILHVSNALVHTINGLLVFILIKQFINNRFAVLIATLFFLLHPMQVESVAWASEFRGLLASFFSLLALYWYLKGGRGTSYFALFLLLLALLSKPSAAVLPLFIFAINHFYYRFSFKRNIIKSLPFIIIVLVMVIVTYIVQTTTGVDNPADYSLVYWLRPFVWLYSIVFYLYKIIFPYYLGASYVLSPQFIVQQWWVYPLALIPLMLGGVLYFLRHKYNLLVLAFVLFVVGFLPTSGFVDFAFQKYSLVADRYVYLAFIGVSLAIAFVLERADKKYLFVVFIGVLLVCAFLSAFRQIPIWKNAFSLWSHSVSMEARPSYAKFNLSAAFQNNIDEFFRIYNKGLALAKDKKLPQAIDAFDYLAVYYLNNGRFKKEYSNLFYSRGAVLVMQNNYKKALADFIMAAKINVNNIEARNARVFMHINLEQYQEAWFEVDNIKKTGLKISPVLLRALQKACPDRSC